MIVLCEKFKILSRKAPGSILLLVFRLILLRNKRSKKSTKDRERKIKKSDGRCLSVANSFKEIEQKNDGTQRENESSCSHIGERARISLFRFG